MNGLLVEGLSLVILKFKNTFLLHDKDKDKECNNGLKN
jgi:hypothetical protein